MRFSILSLALLLFCGVGLFAQAPQAIQYQALVRNATGEPLTNKFVSLRMNVRESNPGGNIVYSEKHEATTNPFGLVNLQIGQGLALEGNFSEITWANNTYFLETQIDLLGGNNFQSLGTSQFVSVPYALYAESALYSINGDGDADPGNEIQSLVLNGHTLSLSNANSVTLPDEVNDADADPANEIQTLSQNGNTISLSKGGGTVNLPPDNDGDPTNEIQTISLNGNSVALSKGGGGFTLPPDNDTDAGNEIQLLSLNGNNLSISQGNNVMLPVASGQWSENGTDLYYNKGNISIGTNSVSGTLTLKGSQSIENNNGQWRTILGTYSDNSPYLDMLGASGGNLFRMESHFSYPDRALFSMYREGNKQLLELGATGNAGYVDVINENNYSLALLSYDNAASPNGYIETNTATAKVQTVMTSTVGTPEGFIATYNSSEKPNVVLTNLASYPGHGYIGVNHSGTNVAGIYADASGNGIVYGNVKSFRMPYPGRSGEEIWYASVEGPEAAAYTRGTAQLKNGEANITFPEHFQIVGNATTMTVQITPLSADSKGIAVIEKSDKGFKVKELFNGKGDYAFDWEVKCVRKGYEDFRAIRSAEECQSTMPAGKAAEFSQPRPTRAERH